MLRRLRRTFIFLFLTLLWVAICTFYAWLVAWPWLSIDLFKILATTLVGDPRRVAIPLGCIVWVQSIALYTLVNERYRTLFQLKQAVVLGYHAFRDRFQIRFNFLHEIAWAVVWTACDKLLPALVAIFGLMAAGHNAFITREWVQPLVVAGGSFLLANFLPHFFAQLFFPEDLADIVRNMPHYQKIMAEQRYRKQPPRLDEYPDHRHDDDDNDDDD